MQGWFFLKGLSDKGFVFYTNFNSKKGNELKEKSESLNVLSLESLRRQVRAIGKVEEVSSKEADDYFNSRPYKNRIGAWASSQSAILDQRETFTNKIKQFEKNFPIKIMCQDHPTGLDGDCYLKK